MSSQQGYGELSLPVPDWMLSTSDCGTLSGRHYICSFFPHQKLAPHTHISGDRSKIAKAIFFQNGISVFQPRMWEVHKTMFQLWFRMLTLLRVTSDVQMHSWGAIFNSPANLHPRLYQNLNARIPVWVMVIYCNGVFWPFQYFVFLLDSCFTSSLGG